MTILNVHIEQVGLVGVTPSIIFIDTNNTIAEVLATGFLNSLPPQGYQISESMMALVSTKTSPSAVSTQVGWFEISKSGADWSLVSTGSPGSVTLPTIANHIATFSNTTGNLSEDPATAISGGNIQAGLSGTAGYLSSFPATLARGSLRLVAANSTGDTVTTITNASQAAARTYTIPDAGVAASSFLMTDSAGTQTIATGSLALTLGNFVVAAGSITATLGLISAGTTVTAGTGIISTTGNIVASAGNLIAGATGAAGSVTSFSGTGANEFLRLAAVDNAGGDFSTTISNAASVGQSQVVSIPDVGAATGNFIAAGAALVSGEFPVLSGTGGRVISSGLAAANIQDKTNIKAATTANIGGGGAGPISVVVAGLTAASVVVGTIESSSNAVQVQTITATATGFDVTFSADPGASCLLNYVAFIAAQ